MWIDHYSGMALALIAVLMLIRRIVREDARSLRRRFGRAPVFAQGLLGRVSDDALLHAYLAARGRGIARLAREAERALLGAVSIVAFCRVMDSEWPLLSKAFAIGTILILMNRVIMPAIDRAVAVRMIDALRSNPVEAAAEGVPAGI